MSLWVEQQDNEKGAPVVLLHGFTQTGRSWGPVAEALAGSHVVITPDAPGHGRSASMRVDLRTGAEALAGAIGPADWVGYSMGGRFALHVALQRPDVVRKLVLVSTTAGLDDPAERAQRRAGDEALAARIETEGVAPFVAWWLTLPLFATLPATAAALETRLGHDPAGLASSLRLAGTGTQEPLWDRLGALTMPVLVVTGALDRAYTERGHRLVEAIGPNARLAVLPDAGHACHLEAPKPFTDLLRTFLEAR